MRRVLLAAGTVGGLTLVVKIAGMARDVVIARTLGTSATLDAFYVAFLVPSIAINVVAGSFNSAFVPAYIQVVENEGSAAANRLLATAIFWVSLLLAILGVGLASSGSVLFGILAVGFSPEKLANVERLFWIMLPSVLLGGIGTVWTSVLNARHRFAWGALVPLAIPVMSTIALVSSPGMAAEALAVGTTVGYALQVGLLALALRREGCTIGMLPAGMTSHLRGVLQQFLPAAAGSLVLNGAPLIDQSMASTLGNGAIASLNYGNKIVSLVAGLGTMAIGTAVLPTFSRLVARGDWDALRQTLRSLRRLLLLVSVPLTLLLILGSEVLVSAMFERGRFTAADTRVVAHTQMLYLLQVPFYSIGILYVRLLSSLRRNDLLLWGTMISLPLNALLDYAFMKQLGVAGIALSTSCVYAISCLYLGFVLRRVLVDASEHELNPVTPVTSTSSGSVTVS